MTPEQSTKFQKQTIKSESFENSMLKQLENNQDHSYACQPMNIQIGFPMRQPLVNKNIETHRHYNTRQSLIAPDKVPTKSINEIQKKLHVEKIKSHCE